jgi:hypothetical protein
LPTKDNECREHFEIGVGMAAEIISVKAIAQVIYLVRGRRVLLDRDLAALYGVETRTLNQAVKRSATRFPDPFMFQLTGKETESLIFQSGRSRGRGSRTLSE